MDAPFVEDIAAAPIEDVDALVAALGVHDVTAQVLVRRGLRDPVEATKWLSADIAHRADQLHGLEDAVTVILGHAERGSIVAVHGDYDVDGVCATTILLGMLADLSVASRHVLPRRSDGYGLREATVRRLADDGVGLLITCDCGITSVDEVRLARDLGLDVVVTDHHVPRGDGILPDAPIVHPALGGYPCPDLCGTGVAAMVAASVRARVNVEGGESDAELVALATVADCVPLVDENRRLVREGLRALAATTRPGLRALMRIAQVDPTHVDEQTVGFRLAPRMNAAGRMDRADVALDLLTTTDPERAGEIADELDRLNHERRHAEERILFDAEAQVRELGERSAYVLWGEGWARGVVGIVASRVAERYRCPAILIALDGDHGVGSGRTATGYNLLGGLEACASHLSRFGGHHAAAGCEVDRGNLDAFRAEFEAHATATISADARVARERVDAIVGGADLGEQVARELASLGPFGQGNPAIRVLVPAASILDQQPLGSSGKHTKFTVGSGPFRASAVAFGQPLVPDDGPVDLVAQIEMHEWRGRVEPRLLVRAARETSVADVAVGDADLWAAIACEFHAPLPGLAGDDGGTPVGPIVGSRDRRGTSIAALLRQLSAEGRSIVAVTADAQTRVRGLSRVGVAVTVVTPASLAVALDADPAAAVVVIDPPLTSRHHNELGLIARDHDVWSVWGDAETAFAVAARQRSYDLRAPLTGLYRDVRAHAATPTGTLEAALTGDPAAPRSPEVVGRVLRVLEELDLVAVDLDAHTVTMRPAEPTSLDRSSVFRAYSGECDHGGAWQSSTTPAAA